MRKFISIIWILLFALGITAQTTTDNLSIQKPYGAWYATYYNLSVDSAETIWSQEFRLNEYDNASFATYPVSYWYRADSDTPGDSVNVSVYVFANWIHPDSTSDWTVVDTLATITSETGGKGTDDFNGYKAPFYKLKIVSNTGGQNLALNFGIYVARKDE